MLETIRTRSDITKGISKTSNIPHSMTWSAAFERNLKKQNKFDIIWYSVFITFGLVCIGLFHKDWMIYLTVGELFAALLVNNLLARGKIAGIWVNIFDCLLFGVICFLTKAYGEMVKTVLISNAFNIYGLISWSRANKKDTNGDSQSSDLSVRTMSKKLLAILLGTFAAGSLATYFVLDAVGTTLAYIGCITFTLNIVIKYTQMSRYKESWWFSIVNSIISTTMWLVIMIQTGLGTGDWSVLPTFGGCLAGLSSNIYGLITWNSMYKKATVKGGNYFAMRPVKINRIVRLKHSELAHLVWSEATDYVPTAEEVRYFKRIKLSQSQNLYM